MKRLLGNEAEPVERGGAWGAGTHNSQLDLQYDSGERGQQNPFASPPTGNSKCLLSIA
jgi:hypothetical protein